MTTPKLAPAASAEKLGLAHKYQLNSESSAPLIFLVHGRAGNLDVMWTFKRCVPAHWNIVAPQAPLVDPIGGFSWWVVGDEIPKSETKANATTASEKLYAFMQNSIAHYKLSPKFVVGAGFSQGSGVLSCLIQNHPQVLRGVGILAGFTVKLSEVPLQGAELPAVFWAHGSKDETIPLERAKKGEEFLKALGLSVETIVDPVGHKVGTNGMKAFSAWLRKLEL